MTISDKFTIMITIVIPDKIIWQLGIIFMINNVIMIIAFNY